MNPLASDTSVPVETTSGSIDPDHNFDAPAHKAADDDGTAVQYDDEGADGPVRLSRRVPLSALAALLSITAARQVRGRRLVIFSLLFALPILFAVLAHRFADPYRASEAETILIFGLIPQALLPLTALLFASGMVQDDVEEQTLTYLLIRPIPRWLIYLVKVSATWLVTSALASVFTAGALVAVYWGEGALEYDQLIQRALLVSVILTLGLLAYVSVFGGLSLVVRRSLVVGVLYIGVLEGVVANIDFVVRHLTVMYYFRTLSVRWLDLSGADWSIDPSTAPSAATCLFTLFGIGGVLAVLGSWVFSVREFRVKTPEGS
jgi:ABC-2 type transport system permease protein